MRDMVVPTLGTDCMYDPNGSPESLGGPVDHELESHPRFDRVTDRRKGSLGRRAMHEKG